MTEPAPVFPAWDLNAALPHLRRPFASNAVKFKVQANLARNRGLLVSYVDARLVVERLTVVCGERWESEIEPIGTGGDLLCSLSVFGVTRQDVGKGGFTKASASDALKRAAVLFGIGASLYATPTWILPSTESGEIGSNGEPSLKRVTDAKGKENLWITHEVERWLRDKYALWLQEEGDRFGEPFDHGDAALSVGDAATEGIGVEDADPQEEAKRQEARDLYTQIPTSKRGKLTPAKFRAKLEACDNGQIEVFVEELKEMANA